MIILLLTSDYHFSLNISNLMKHSSDPYSLVLRKVLSLFQDNFRSSLLKLPESF